MMLFGYGTVRTDAELTNGRVYTGCRSAYFVRARLSSLTYRTISRMVGIVFLRPGAPIVRFVFLIVTNGTSIIVVAILIIDGYARAESMTFFFKFARADGAYFVVSVFVAFPIA